MSEDGAAAPRNSVQLPWGEGRPERADLFIMGAITLSGLYLLALIPLTPALVGDHPVWLELLKGSMSGMITMGAKARIGDASMVVAVLAAIPGLMLFDWLYWWAGRRWGTQRDRPVRRQPPEGRRRDRAAGEAHPPLRLAGDRDRVLPARAERADLRRRRLDAACACARS